MLKRLAEYLSFSVGALALGTAVRRPDVVMALSPPPTLGLIGLSIARIRRRPLVYVVQDLYPEVAIASGVFIQDRRFPSWVGSCGSSMRRAPPWS